VAADSDRKLSASLSGYHEVHFVAGPPADSADIRWHLEVIRHELRPPLGILDLAEGHAEAAGDAQLADALATLGHRLVETLDAYERAVEALDALEAIGRERATPTG